MERHLAKQKTWEAELKRQFKPMKPVAIGCVWDDEIPSILRQLEACCLLTEGNIDPTCAKKEYQEPSVTTSPNTTTYCNTAMPVPEEGKVDSLIKTELIQAIIYSYLADNFHNRLNFNLTKNKIY